MAHRAPDTCRGCPLPSKHFSSPVDLELVHDNLEVMSISVKSPLAARPVAKQLSTGELRVVRHD